MKQSDEKYVSLNAQDQYMRALRWTPPLTPQEEATLFQRVEEGRRERQKAVPDHHVLTSARQARDRLVEGFQGLVVTIAKSFRRQCASMELLDLVQEGNIGLLYAVEHYQPNEVGSFVPIASLCIRRNIQEALKNYDRMIRLPKHVGREVAIMLQAKRQLEEYIGTEPTAQQIAYAMHVSVEHVYELLEWSMRNVGSLDHILEEDGEDREAECESIFPGGADGTAEQVSTPSSLVERAFAQALSPRQQEVMRLRYGLDGSGTVRTQYEVAKLLGIGQNRVSDVERRAKVLLRNTLSSVMSDEGGAMAS